MFLNETRNIKLIATKKEKKTWITTTGFLGVRACGHQHMCWCLQSKYAIVKRVFIFGSDITYKSMSDNLTVWAKVAEVEMMSEPFPINTML